MRQLARRDFLRQSAVWGLAAGAGSWPAAQSLARAGQPAGATRRSANDRLVLAVVGVRGRGHDLAQGLADRPDCEVAYLADVDLDVAGARRASIDERQGRGPKIVQDFRRALDDRAVDALVVATPDHWHALATIWGCQAGKHVYVEKPASHSPWEGRKMVEAARKYRRVVQVGLQNRSSPSHQRARQWIASGKLGRVQLCRVYNQQASIQAPWTADSSAPKGLDWKMWSGPAPLIPYNVNLHNAWNHYWHYSGGDVIHEGVHQLDLARWLIGKEYPDSVSCTGRRDDEDSVHETPSAQMAVYDFGDVSMTYQLSPYSPLALASDQDPGDGIPPGLAIRQGARVEVYGTQGVLIVGEGGAGWRCYARNPGRTPVLLAEDPGDVADAAHLQDFCESIREGRPPSADIEEGHRSTLLCQYANIGYRLGGTRLTIDAATESTNSRWANALLKREYRKGWAVPDQV